MVLLRIALVLLLAALPARAIEAPKWFAPSFLDFREEVREAAANGKRVMIYGQEGCPYCRRLVEVNLAQPAIAQAMQRDFVSIALDLWGDRETHWIDGKARPEKDLARLLKVQFTPTLLFLDEAGGVALRVNGYQPPERFALAIEYAGRRLERKQTLAEFIAERGGTKAAPAKAPPAKAAQAPVKAGGDKPQLIVFETRDCEQCMELEQAFERPEIRRALAALRKVHVDVAAERDLVRKLGVSFTPTLVFFDRGGAEIFRIEGYVRPFHLVSAIEYVSQGAWRTEPSFQRFLHARADRERAAGRPVEIW
jgi:thioredoxin-related protein